jgi:hypothetical protein
VSIGISADGAQLSELLQDLHGFQLPSQEMLNEMDEHLPAFLNGLAGKNESRKHVYRRVLGVDKAADGSYGQ